VRQRIAEQREQSVAQLLRYMAAHLGDSYRSGVEISANEVTPLLSIELC
jgi:hypothetical protein